MILNKIILFSVNKTLSLKPYFGAEASFFN